MRMLERVVLTAGFGAVVLAAQVNRAWNQPVKPFKVIGNIDYVGASGVSSHLITTPAGHILIDSGFAETVPLIRASVAKMGFRFEDIKILLSSHAHMDHVGGHALVKEYSGCRVMATAPDAAVIASGDGGRWKGCKVDRIIADGEQVKLGGAALTAHLTPGHTKGCTTWTMTVAENGRTYNVVFVGGISINAGVHLVGNARYPEIAEDYARTFRVLKSLACDVFLAQHPDIFGMQAKAARLEAGSRSNPFIDPEGYRAAIEKAEQAYLRQLKSERGD